MECAGSGQDGELALGRAWPVPRFEQRGEVVLDRLTGLEWTRDTDLGGGMVSWQRGCQQMHELNAGRRLGSGWRLPTINELESLIDASTARPALPPNHPFDHLREAYWSATESGFDPAWAFCLYLHKGAVGVGFKPAAEFHCWPVRSRLADNALKLFSTS